MIDLGRETNGNNETCLSVHFALCIMFTEWTSLTGTGHCVFTPWQSTQDLTSAKSLCPQLAKECTVARLTRPGTFSIIHRWSSSESLTQIMTWRRGRTLVRKSSTAVSPKSCAAPVFVSADDDVALATSSALVYIPGQTPATNGREPQQVRSSCQVWAVEGKMKNKTERRKMNNVFSLFLHSTFGLTSHFVG